MQALEFLTSGLGHLFILQRPREAKPPVQGHKANLWQGQGQDSVSAWGIHLTEAPQRHKIPEESCPLQFPKSIFFCCI